MDRILYIFLVVLLFGVLIAIHEFGHFCTAKLLKVKVNEFSIGMGPLIWKRTRGETQYSLRALPVGGYCAMEGEDEDTGDPRAFACQPLWKKFIILVAGSLMNFLLGLVIVVVLFWGSSEEMSPVIQDFAEGFPSQLQGEQGLQAGDRLLRIDGHAVWVYEDINLFLSRNDGEGMDLVVLRDGQRVQLRDFPLERAEYSYQGQAYTGFGLIFGGVEEVSFLGQLKLSFLRTLDFVRVVWMSLGDLVTGHVGISEMSGVIGIVDVVSQAGTQAGSLAVGVWNVFYYMALIAVNLAVMNLLPIPALDGGRIAFLLLNGLVHLLFRRTIPEQVEGYIHAAFLLLLLVFMAVIAVQDVWKIFLEVH